MANGGYSLAVVCGFLTVWLLLLHVLEGEWASVAEARRFSSCGSGVWAQSFCRKGLAAPCHVESSQTRDLTGDPSPQGGFLTTGPPGQPLYFLTRLGAA